LEASPDPIDGVKVIYLNPAFTRVLGWTLYELLGKKVDYVPEENWPETQMMIDKVLA
jgi:PAS domain S-box-containing protein